LQINVGDVNPHIHKTGYLVISNAISTYIPEHLLDDKTDYEWEVLLAEQHLKHKGKSTFVLKCLYLDIVRQWPYYGCTFFRAKNNTQTNQNFFSTDFEGKVTIGVNQKGVHIIEPRVMSILTFPFDKVVDWNSQKQTFFLEVEDEDKIRMKGGMLEKSLSKLKPLKSFTIKAKKTPTREFYFKSSQAELINDLICDWLEEYYEQKEREEGFGKVVRRSKQKTRTRDVVQPINDDILDL